jgi:uncharacterized protein
MYKETTDGVVIAIKVVPKSSHNEIVGWENDELKVRIAAVPDQGKANDELVAFLAKTFKVSKSQVILLAGEKSRHKRVLIKSMSIATMPAF